MVKLLTLLSALSAAAAVATHKEGKVQEIMNMIETSEFSSELSSLSTELTEDLTSELTINDEESSKPWNPEQADIKLLTEMGLEESAQLAAGTGAVVPPKGAGSSEPTMTSAFRAALVRSAAQHLGKKYVYGAVGPHTFDCSGLVKTILEENGVKVPLRTVAQMRQKLPKVSREDVQPGDLVFFNIGAKNPNHIGMVYTTSPLTMIHAGTSSDVSFARLDAGTYWPKYVHSFGTWITANDEEEFNAKPENQVQGVFVPAVPASIYKRKITPPAVKRSAPKKKSTGKRRH